MSHLHHTQAKRILSHTKAGANTHLNPENQNFNAKSTTRNIIFHLLEATGRSTLFYRTGHQLICCVGAVITQARVTSLFKLLPGAPLGQIQTDSASPGSRTTAT